MSKKKVKRLTLRQVLWGIFVGFIFVLLLGIIVLQAFLRISSGDYAGGENYMRQPVGPFQQLAGILIVLIVLIIGAYYHFRSKPKRSKKEKRLDDAPRPKWINEPPYKFPWQ